MSLRAHFGMSAPEAGSDAPVVRRHLILTAIAGGVLIAVLRYLEYRTLIVAHSVEIYVGLVALLFSVAGIWLGVTLTGRP